MDQIRSIVELMIGFCWKVFQFESDSNEDYFVHTILKASVVVPLRTVHSELFSLTIEIINVNYSTKEKKNN